MEQREATNSNHKQQHAWASHTLCWVKRPRHNRGHSVCVHVNKAWKQVLRRQYSGSPCRDLEGNWSWKGLGSGLLEMAGHVLYRDDMLGTHVYSLCELSSCFILRLQAPFSVYTHIYVLQYNLQTRTHYLAFHFALSLSILPPIYGTPTVLIMTFPFRKHLPCARYCTSVLLFLTTSVRDGRSFCGWREVKQPVQSPQQTSGWAMSQLHDPIARALPAQPIASPLRLVSLPGSQPGWGFGSLPVLVPLLLSLSSRLVMPSSCHHRQAP